MPTLSDAQLAEERIRVDVVRGLGEGWYPEGEFKGIVQRSAQIPAYDHAAVDAAMVWLWNLGQIERRITDDGEVQYRRAENPPPLVQRDGTSDLSQQAARAAELERQAYAAESAKYLNPDFRSFREAVRAIVRETLAERDAANNDTATGGTA